MRKYRELLKEYKAKKTLIRKRLDEFKKTGLGSDEDIFTELCFCILLFCRNTEP
jgi:thermostable 8-oxoguanine DNA glycosylase